MLSFQVKEFRGRTGERIVLLRRREGEPYFYPTAFATAEYVITGRSPNTLIRVLRSIGMAIMWADVRGRDLDHDLAQGDLITVSEASDLARFLSLNADDQVKEVSKPRSPAARANVVRLEALRPDPRGLRDKGPQKVDEEEVGARLRWVARYIEWHIEERFGDVGALSPLDRQRAEVGAQIVGRLRHLAPSVSSGKSDDEALEAPDIEVLDQIERILTPGSKDNPFKSSFVQERNYLIWRLLLDTGGRRHEIHSTKVRDVDTAHLELAIRVSKTRARTVGIRKETADAFEIFFENHWRHFDRKTDARRLNLLFTNEEGGEISLRVVNRLFESIRPVIVASPHAIRRAWNYVLSKKINAMPAHRRPSDKEEANIRIRLMGWSEKSRQPERYNRRHIRERADEIASQLLEGAPPPAETIKRRRDSE